MEEFRDEMLETPEQESRPMAFRSLHYMQRLMLRRREITKTGPRPRPRELQNTRHFAGRMLVRVKQLRSRPRLASSEISFGVTGSSRWKALQPEPRQDGYPVNPRIGENRGAAFEAALTRGVLESQKNFFDINQDSESEHEILAVPGKSGTSCPSADAQEYKGRRIAVTTLLACSGLHVYAHRKPMGDWVWGDQDGGSYGVIVSIDVEKARCRVRWAASGTVPDHFYRIGRFGKLDLCTRTEDYFAALARLKKNALSRKSAPNDSASGTLSLDESSRLIRRGMLVVNSPRFWLDDLTTGAHHHDLELDNFSPADILSSKTRILIPTPSPEIPKPLKWDQQLRCRPFFPYTWERERHPVPSRFCFAQGKMIAHS